MEMIESIVWIGIYLHTSYYGSGMEISKDTYKILVNDKAWSVTKPNLAMKQEVMVQ